MSASKLRLNHFDMKEFDPNSEDEKNFFSFLKTFREVGPRDEYDFSLEIVKVMADLGRCQNTSPLTIGEWKSDHSSWRYVPATCSCSGVQCYISVMFEYHRTCWLLF